jgi:hypothetical protein
MTEDPRRDSPADAAPAAALAPQPAVQLRIGTVAKLNLADFQNAVPALRELAVVNEGDLPLQQLSLQLVSEPAFIKPRTWRLESVAAHGTYALTDLDVALDGALLSRLTEAEPAVLRLELRSGPQAEVLLARHEHTVELLARNQWGGLGHLPEMVAAFVQPNDPAVDRILKGAAQALEAGGKSGAINGYELGPQRAWELASAIWTAVLRKKLNYALPPASFEHAGQKIRGAGQVLDAGLATCLDLALLFASCLEQAHLNPLLVFTRGHAFVGLWLGPQEFSTAVVDDVTAVRKRLKLQELVVFEATLAAQGQAVAFSQAIAQGGAPAVRGAGRPVRAAGGRAARAHAAHQAAGACAAAGRRACPWRRPGRACAYRGASARTAAAGTGQGGAHGRARSQGPAGALAAAAAGPVAAQCAAQLQAGQEIAAAGGGGARAGGCTGPGPGAQAAAQPRADAGQ